MGWIGWVALLIVFIIVGYVAMIGRGVEILPRRSCFSRTMRERSTGIGRRPTRAIPTFKRTLGSCMLTAWECRRIMLSRSCGSPWRQPGDMRRRRKVGMMSPRI
jgi:hypothetical protein